MLSLTSLVQFMEFLLRNPSVIEAISFSISSHSASESRSCCKKAAFSSFLICMKNNASSANNLVSLAVQSGRLLMKAMGNSSPSTVQIQHLLVRRLHLPVGLAASYG